MKDQEKKKYQAPPWRAGGSCESCGQPAPAGRYHVGVHDCKNGEWDLIVITPQGWDEVAAIRAEMGQ